MQRHHHDPEVTTGRPAVNLISRILSHLTIVLASVLVVLFLIDQAKRGEMSFLANQTTKWMLFALALLSIAGAAFHLSTLSRLHAIRKYMELRERRRGKE
jgi:hypothetical protein